RGAPGARLRGAYHRVPREVLDAVRGGRTRVHRRRDRASGNAAAIDQGIADAVHQARGGARPQARQHPPVTSEQRGDRVFETDDGRKIDVPDGLTPEEERAVLMALARYFGAENPKPAPWVLQGRIEATGYGALQVRRFAREPWHGQWVEFARKGVPPMNGRADVRCRRRRSHRSTRRRCPVTIRGSISVGR